MNINASYLDQLSAFTKFANERINANDNKAVASIYAWRATAAE